METSLSQSRRSIVRMKSLNHYLTLAEKCRRTHWKPKLCPFHTYPSPWIYVVNRHTANELLVISVPTCIAPSEDVQGLDAMNGIQSPIKPLSCFFFSGFLNFRLWEFHRWHETELLCICKCALTSKMMLCGRFNDSICNGPMRGFKTPPALQQAKQNLEMLNNVSRQKEFTT